MGDVNSTAVVLEVATFAINRARQDLSLTDFVEMCNMVATFSSHIPVTALPSNYPSAADIGPTGPVSWSAVSLLSLSTGGPNFRDRARRTSVFGEGVGVRVSHRCL